MSESLIGKTTREGGAVFECAACRDAGGFTALYTAHALARDEIPNGLRFRGIACPTCGKSYTLEITDPPTE